MHSFHRTAAILKLTDKHKGPSGSLRGVKNWNPSAHILSSMTTHKKWMENSDSQPKMHGTKKKSLSNQIDFFLMFKHYQKSESEDPLAFPKS